MTEQTIFLAALDIPDPGERTAYLDRACAGDPALRQQVEALLSAHEKSGLFLDEPALEQAAGRAGGPNARTVSADDPPGPDTPTFTSPDSARAGGDDLGFLQPPTRPGSLGRLAHYEVLEVLGRGGFGTVLRAFDDRLHRVVAIKVLAPQLATSGTARARFQREARAGAAVRDEHVVAIHAVGSDDEPIPYLVMEYVAGQTLQQKLDRTGPLSVREILRIGSQIARGLAAAHATGLIHRDIKPSNVLLENGVERVKITDFGLARAADDASISHSGVVAGTPQYMAPEQAQGIAIDHRADLFSLGSVLYAMCTGRPPFRATTTMAVLKRVCEEDPRPAREINPEVPEWLCAVIAKLHAKRREDRFQSAKEVADLLQQHLAHLEQPDRAPMPAPVAPPAPPAAGVWRSAVWSPDMFWTMAALVAAAGAIIVYIQWRYGDLRAQWPADLGVATVLGLLLWLYARRVWPPRPARRPPLLRPAWAAGAGVSVLLFLALAYYQDGALRLFLRNEAKVALVDAEHVAVEVTVLQAGAVAYDRSADREFVLDADAPTEVRVFKAPAGVELFRREVPLRAGMTTQVSVARELADAEERNRAGAGDQLGKVAQEAADAGWVALFNGTDLTGWEPHPDQPGTWDVKDGVLIGSTRHGYLFSGRGDYANFHLRADIRLNAGGDSGIRFRAPFALRKGILAGHMTPAGGYEAEINGSRTNAVRTGSVRKVKSEGPPMTLHGAADDPLVRPDEWFTLEVIAEQNRFVTKVNGRVVADCLDSQAAYPTGHLALQVFSPNTVVRFRKIEIKELPPGPPAVPRRAADVLPFMAGNWKVERQDLDSKLPPGAGSATADARFDWAPGRNVLRYRDGLGSEFGQPLILFSHDPATDSLRRWYFWSGGRTFGPVPGAWNPNSRTLLWMNRIDVNTQSNIEYHLVDANTIVSKMYRQDPRNELVGEWHMKFTRTIEPVAIPDPPADPARPPEMKVLDRLTGEWRDEWTVKDPGQGQERAETVHVKVAPVLGGRFVEGSEVHETTGAGDYWVAWFDARYRAWYFGATGSASEFTGTWDDPAQTLIWKSQDGTVEKRWAFKSDDRRDLWQAVRNKDGKLLAESTGLSRRTTPGWTSLFNGKDLAGWRAHPGHPGPWSVKDGVLRGAGARSVLMGAGEYGDFHLKAVARVNDGGDAALLFRADKAKPEKGPPRGYAARINATIQNVPRTGSLEDTFAQFHTGKDPRVKPGEWFTYEVIAQGYRIRLKVNGQTTLDWTDGKKQRALGALALHLANDKTVVEVRSLEVKDLSAAAGPRAVRLHAFRPGRDRLPVPPRGPADAVTVVGDAWRIENTTDTGNFHVAVAQGLGDLPKDGVLVFRARVKVEAKDKVTWGSLGFGNADQLFIAWDEWPGERARYDGNDSDWVEREARYPAAEVHQRNPPTVHLYAGLHANGVLWLKDVELLHLPADPPGAPPPAAAPFDEQKAPED